MKPDFEKAQNAATELLLGQNIDSLYIDARNFKLPSNIIIDSIQNFSQLTHYPLSLLNTDKIDGALVLSQGNKKLFSMMMIFLMSNESTGVLFMNSVIYISVTRMTVKILK